jgi:hypothetical protein
MWVGKFETGYDGATSTSASQTDVDKVDTSKIIIKPNVYSWRNIKVGNIFKNSYDYLRNDESHMMKNTEWGAVTYLSHSIYGTCASSTKCSEVRINNNSAFITGYASLIAQSEGNLTEDTDLGEDGVHTISYSNKNGPTSSTTGNFTGVYDMSGGAWEYIMGYTTVTSTIGGISKITTLYSDFFTNNNWNKYYDVYNSNEYSNYNNRIFGDSTGEMGPFYDTESNYVSNSWYKDCSYFIFSENPWFLRGGRWSAGTGSGIFAFHNSTGGENTDFGFRIVLSPSK